MMVTDGFDHVLFSLVAVVYYFTFNYYSELYSLTIVVLWEVVTVCTGPKHTQAYSTQYTTSLEGQ